MRNNKYFIRFYAVMVAFMLAVVCFTTVLPNRSFHAVAEETEPHALETLQKCVEYADTHPFATKMYAEVEARVFGIKYMQVVCGDRHVNGSEYSERAESVSTFVKAAIKKSRSGGKYYVSHGKFKRGKAEYSQRNELSEEKYTALYGTPPLGLLKYELDGNILSARQTGENEYTFTLDPQKSTANRGVEVRTMLGGGSLPKYRSVEVVLYTDGVKPIKTVCRERLRVDKFGGVECSAKYEETFRF